MLAVLRVWRDRFRANCSCATLLCVGARDGIGRGGRACDSLDESLSSKEDLAFRTGENPPGESPTLGDGGDEPIEELSVTDAPLDLEGIDEVSDSLSVFLDEFEDTEDTFLNF